MLAKVSENIKDTIGCVHEIISFDNRGAELGICEIYNKGAELALYDILCYMHEDISFKDANWGGKVVSAFKENTNLGILGVVGGSYKTLIPSGWGVDAKQTNFSNYLQSYKRSNKSTTHFYNNPTNQKLGKVVCVDGLWLCTKREIALTCRFDQELLEGFHCYDIDFCLNVGQKFDVCVIFDVLIEHFSEGSYDDKWLSDTLKLHEKWKFLLPKYIIEFPLAYTANLEKIAFKRLILHFFKEGKSLKEAFSLLKQYKKENFMSVGLYLKLQYYVWKYYMKEIRKSI